MSKVDLKITFECPACKQINEDVPFSRIVYIHADTEYIGSGEYVGDVGSVHITCTGCKAKTEIDY